MLRELTRLEEMWSYLIQLLICITHDFNHLNQIVMGSSQNNSVCLHIEDGGSDTRLSPVSIAGYSPRG